MGEDIAKLAADPWAWAILTLVPALVIALKKLIVAGTDALVRRAEQLWAEDDDAHCDSADKAAQLTKAINKTTIMPLGVVRGAVEQARVNVKSDPPPSDSSG